MLCFVSLSAFAAVFGLIPNLKSFKDKTGAVATFHTAGDIHETNAFFRSLGTNGRTCATCHQADQAFSLSAHGVREVYERTEGKDPLFAAFDGANCPTDTSNERATHSLLLDRGLIRIGLTIPPKTQFTISVVHDPYGCAVTIDPTTGRSVISVYRRPLPTANLRYLSTIMFDGRETLLPLNKAQTFQQNLTVNLADQATSAVLTHAQEKAPTAEQLAEIVTFELGLSTAQIRNNEAGALNAYGADGGPLALSMQSYYPGTNDALGGDPTGAKFNPNAFSLYAAWVNNGNDGRGNERRDDGENRERNEAREEIAAGERLFNTRSAIITDVRGLNENATLGSPASVRHLHYLPRHTQRGQPLRGASSGHRY